ncbi:MAG TPA: hypothetical protein VKO18_04710 [Terriglobia bacterium]|nr:hypothetical protein [Terriglobia bacterium]
MTTSRYAFGKPIVKLFACLRGPLARRIGLLGLAGTLLCVLVGVPALAQTSSPVPSKGQKVQAPLSHLYWHFLLYQNHLDKVATQREQQGKNGAWLRNHFQNELGFTDAQFAVVRATAQRLETELKGVDAQAKAIIDADHAAHRQQSGSPHTWRPVPPELKALQQQHEAVIQSEVSHLKGALGPDLAAKLDALLQSELARNVTVQRFHHPGPDPSVVRQRMLEARQEEEKEEHQ